MTQKSANAVDIHIDELVVSSVEGIDRDRLVQSIGRELTRLVADDATRSIVARTTDLAEVDRGALELELGTDALGTRLASAIHRRLFP